MFLYANYLGYYQKMSVKIYFLDARKKKKVISAHSKVGITEQYLHIMARKLSAYLLNKKNRLDIERKGIPNIKGIPTFTDQHIFEIYDLARKYNVSWWQLMNLLINLQNIRSKGLSKNYGGNFLTLAVDTPQGSIEIRIGKQKYRGSITSPDLIELSRLIRRYEPQPDYPSTTPPPTDKTTPCLQPPIVTSLSSNTCLPPEKSCPYCGIKTPADAPFCPKCGSSI
jgi:hypothetical protein